MNIVIISGGSGNDSLITGIKNIYKNANIKVIVNAYDNGKSTGICRQITNTLGVSDIRKNHIRMYKATTPIVDNRLVDFYTLRFNFNKDTIIDDIDNKLIDWGLLDLIPYARNFFKNENAYEYEYNDFNVANIVYSQMYKELGYEKTNKYFCDLLEIDDFVILNSFDNVYISAITQNYKILDDEGLIVEYANKEDPIKKLIYDNKSKTKKLNKVAVDNINNADLIIISTGTMWSSIYPTLEYLDFYKLINNSKAKKIWAINNEEDKDSYGVSSNDFIDLLNNLGLNLNQFTILENLNSIDSLHLKNDNYNIVYAKMGNVNGKHIGSLYAETVLKIYYNLFNKTYDYYLFDFDDTLFARDSNSNEELYNISVNNLTTLNNTIFNKSYIISGNDYTTIKEKLYRVFGTNGDNCKLKIWADANSTLYINYKCNKIISELQINDVDIKSLEKFFKEKYNLKVKVNDSKTCIKIKPLPDVARKLLVDFLPHIFYDLQIDYCKGIITGRTTVDIVSSNNTKMYVFETLKLEDYNTLYIGDEVDSGNDVDIASYCSHAIHTSDVEETNVILKLLI